MAENGSRALSEQRASMKVYMFIFIYIYILAPYARTTRYEAAFWPEDKKRPRSLRSIGLALLLLIMVVTQIHVHICT